MDSVNIMHGAETTHYMMIKIPGTIDFMKINRNWVTFPDIFLLEIDFTNVDLVTVICPRRQTVTTWPGNIFKEKKYPGVDVID